MPLNVNVAADRCSRRAGINKTIFTISKQKNSWENSFCSDTSEDKTINNANSGWLVKPIVDMIANYFLLTAQITIFCLINLHLLLLKSKCKQCLDSHASLLISLPNLASCVLISCLKRKLTFRR